MRGFVSVSLVLALAACGSKKDKRAPSADPAAGPTTLPTGPIVEPGGAPPTVLDMANGARAILGGKGPRHSEDGFMVAFSPDGRRLASMDRRGGIFVWDVATGAPLERSKVEYPTFVGFRGDALVSTPPQDFAMAAISDDGGWAYTDSQLLEIATGNITPFALTNVYGVSVRGTTIAVIAEDRTVTVGPITGGRTTIATPDEKAYSALLSPDGKQVAVFLENKTIRLHRVAGGAPRVLTMESVMESSDGATNAAWSPDGAWLAVVLYGTVLGLVDISRGQYSEVARDSFGNDLGLLVWSPNGRAIAAITKYGRVRLWDARTGSLVHEHDGVTGTVWDIAVTADGTTVAASGDENAYLWNLAGATATEQKLGDHEHWVTHVALSEDGKRLVSCSDYGDINMRSVATGKLIGKGQIRSGDCEGLAMRDAKIFAFDGTKLEVTSAGRVDAPSVALAAGRKYGSSTFAASRDGSLVAAGGDSGEIAVHRASGALVWKFTMPDDPNEEGQRFEPHALAFDPTGTYLASAGGDDIVRIHELRTGRITRTIKLDFETPGWAAAITWSGSRVVIGRTTGEIQAFDSTGKRVLDVRHRLGGVYSIAATASQIYAGGADGSISIWDLP